MLKATIQNPKPFELTLKLLYHLLIQLPLNIGLQTGKALLADVVIYNNNIAELLPRVKHA
jgi:hypothetical protein